MTREPGPDVDLFGRPARKGADWSHRRDEPRGLALAWTIYLMLTTLGSLAPAFGLGRFDADVYRPAARLLMVLVMVGLVVLWPMVRLAQLGRVESPGRFVSRDLIVLLLPALTLVWPQVILADWPASVVGALTGVLVAWSLVTGAVLVFWSRVGGSRVVPGWGVMVFVLCVVAGSPLVLWRSGVLDLGAVDQGVTRGWMWTPVTGVWELVRDRAWSGRPARVGAAHWFRVLWLLAGGAGVFMLSLWSSGRSCPTLSD